MADEEISVEEKAMNMGWVPEEDFKGDKSKWRPAEEFVERGENYVPILRDRVKKADEKIEVLSQQLNVMQMATDEQKKEFEKLGYDTAKREFDQKVTDLKKQQIEAVGEGDSETYLKLEEDISKLEEPEKPAATVPEQPEGAVEFNDWKTRNEWYQNDTDLTAYADGIHMNIAQANPGISPKDLFEKVTEKVKAVFPGKFVNENRDTDNKVDSPGVMSGKNSSKKTWADLPETAKTAFNRQKTTIERQGGEFTKDQYLKLYFEE